MIKLILNIFLLTTIFSFIYCQETEPPCEENGTSSDQTTDTPSVTKKIIPPFDFIFPKRTPPPNFCHDELNEEYFDCIGLCPQYKHFRDKNCEDVAKEEQQNHITTTESLLSKKLHHLCFSLRCFPGCRCKEGLVREFYGENATCISPEKCKDVTLTTTTEKNCEENENN